MKALEFYGDDFLLEIGRITVLRGEIRHMLLSAGNQLLSTRLGDQGIATLLMSNQSLTEIFRALLSLAELKALPPDMLADLTRIYSDHAEDLEDAGKVVNGSWTYLGGVDEPHYGLHLGEVVRDGDLESQWRHTLTANLTSLAKCLEDVLETLQPVPRSIAFAKGGGCETPGK